VKNDLPKIARDRFQTLLPGMVLCATIAMAATFLGTNYGAPVMLFALLLGMAFNFVDETGKFMEGVQFSSKTILRIGVAFLGARITINEVLNLGAMTTVIVIGGLVSTVLLGLVLAKMLGKTKWFGLLTAGSVGICGASAALAISSALPKSEQTIVERDTIFTVVAVTSLSTIAMIVYPLIASGFGLNEIQAGVFFGATIHDVAQVVGAGYTVSDLAGETSTVVKLMRVAMLVPVVAIISIIVANRKPAADKKINRFPPFLVGFVALVIINSFGWIPPFAADVFTGLSKWALVAAVAGLGVKTSLKELFEVGPAAMIMVVAETIWIAGFALLVLTYF
jgi:uncharacterized integral membrane protein (TIGR00698 family)